MRSVSRFSAFLTTTLLLLAFGATACDTNETGNLARTYPHALDLEMVSLAPLKDSIPAPDSLNVEAYVVTRSVCPPRYRCFLGDSIVIGESRHLDAPEEGVVLFVGGALQFVVGRRYLMSIGISDDVIGEPEAQRVVRQYQLLGYDPLHG